MKKSTFVLGVTVCFATAIVSLRAQVSDPTDQSIQSASDLQTMLEAIESVPPVPASQLPESGNFYSAQHSPLSAEPWPPLPGNIFDLPAWPLGDNFYLLDDTNVDYDAIQALAAQTSSTTALTTGGMGFGPLNVIPDGAVYISNFSATLTNDSVTASFSIAGGTNGVAYDIYSTTNLADSPIPFTWTWLGQGYTSNSYYFSNQPPDQAFYALAVPQQTMVIAWGDDESGQCEVPPGLTNVIAVAGGADFSLALKADGTVVAWGDDTYGQCEVPADLSNVVGIAAGDYHSVAVREDGTIIQWGTNWENVPTDLTNVVAVAAGYSHTLALRSDGTVVSWGARLCENSFIFLNIPL